MFKIWPITSFEEYLNDWPSIANKFTILTNYQQKNYDSPEDFFNKNAIAAQQLANDRVGGILERIFSTTDLAPAVQSELKKFTYRAIDYLRMNDSEVMQIDRQNQTSYNNGRSDLTQISGFSNLELVIGSSAWRAWTNSKIEQLYASYCQQYNVDFLLDPNQFYNKIEIDKFLKEIDDAIQAEHFYTNLKNEEVNNKIDDLADVVNTKQNVTDQLLLQQELDENEEPVGEVQNLGYFDELMIQSNKPNSTIVTTAENKKRAIVNLNSTIGELITASIFQSSSETDSVNAIGRIWGWGIENQLNAFLQNYEDKIAELENKIKEVDDSKWIIGEFKWVKIGTPLQPGWRKAGISTGQTLVAGTTEGLTPGSVISHSHEASTYISIKSSGGQAGPEWINVTKNVYGATNDVNVIKPQITVSSFGGTYNLPAGRYAELWEYIGVGSKSVNFTVPYWEEIKQAEEEKQARLRKLEQTPTFADLEPLKQEVEEVKSVVEQKLPVIEELDAKEKFRMKKLGIDPSSKYWKEGDENGGS